MADVQKSAFSLSSATIMLGKAFTDDVFGLTPDLNSVGMVSQCNINLDSSVTELLNGVSQSQVDSKRTGVKSSISGNVYEMTAQNIMRAQAMSGVAKQYHKGVLTAAAASGAVSLSIASDPVPGEPASAITAITDIPAGSTVLIQRVNGETDFVFPTKTTADATGTGGGPFTVAIAAPYAIPAGMSFPAGSNVWIVSPIGVGNIDADDLFCVKVTGVLSSYNRPVTFVAPKVRMVKGFAVSFNETQYSSMPWEMQPLLLSRGEANSAPRLLDIGTRQPGLLYVGG